MRWEELYLTGIGSYLPEARETAAHAIAAGRFDEIERQKTGQRAAAVSAPELGETAPEMAVAAGARAITASGVTPADIDLLVHAVVLHNGLEAWNCGAYIQDRLAIDNCLPLEIRTACAGAIVGIEMIGRWFGGAGRGLVTASDVWALPLFDRWSSDSGLVYGDGAGAAVVGPDRGPFRVLSTSVVSDPALERMHRGNDVMDMPAYRSALPLDLRTRVAGFTEHRSIDEFWTRNAAALSRCAETALADAGVHHDDVRTWIVPNFGDVLLRKQCFEPLKIRPQQTLVELGHDIGHTGAADPLLGLDLLAATDDLRPSDLIVLTGIGVGFTWGCAVVEATDLVTALATG
ncbi:3-oxoacyl-ACP synthase III family protein [Nocardia shimofusensis]|uniref:3-oxoacyl-ACP synthase III family protein n=1 Tax=Nocardia shimofusensis TaxID=228596 RepID=UPI00082F3F1E|nr:3-oxoacyl-[acyl-carrier-protein] synthase III C-terminal domain-containing protein [Nocardia shimofusensis]